MSHKLLILGTSDINEIIDFIIKLKNY